jgi:hypothetical protein
MTTIFVIVFMILITGALPIWPSSAGWGYYPSGTAGLILLIVILRMAFRRA